MNNAYFGQFLKNHTWSQLQGSNPLGRKYWESPVYTGRTKGNPVNVYTQDTVDVGMKAPLPANSKFKLVSHNKWNYYDEDFLEGHPERFPNTLRKWKNLSIEAQLYDQNELNNISIYKQGLNSGWFPDYSGNFLDLKERGSVTRPCSFDFSQTFKPTQMDSYEQNKFYNIQLGQNMRNQSVQNYGFVAANPNPAPLGYIKRPGSYYFAVTL